MIYETDLFSFSFVPNWYLQLDALAELALSEPWRFRSGGYSEKNYDTPILERYIQSIFRKQVIDYNAATDKTEQDRIILMRNEYACFHTGLYTKRYKPIYACFGRNKKLDSLLKWCFRGFADENSALLRYISPLPEKPLYSMPLQGIHYVPDWPVRVNVEQMLTILASYAQEESLSASENQKWRIRKAFENGELVNLRFLFGYNVTTDGIQVDEREAAIVREIFTRFNGGESLSAISRDLNGRGCERTFGGTWCADRIRNLLSNEKYTGNALLQKQYRKNHIDKKLVPNRGELPMYYVTGSHEPIIDQAAFDKAQVRLNELSRQAEKREKPTRSTFSGLIRCGLCGSTYKRVTCRGKHFWNCTTFQTKGKAECPAKKIPAETLEALACEVLGTEVLDPDMVRSKITMIRAEKNIVVVFCMDDGPEIVKRWKDRSRAESWSPEMKEQARQRALQTRRVQK